MGAAGVLELLGNLPSFADCVVHATINCPTRTRTARCRTSWRTSRGVQNDRGGRVDHVLNNSFGMLGINSVVIVKRPPDRRSVGLDELTVGRPSRTF